MELLFYEKGTGGRRENFWYLVFKADEGQFYVKHVIDNSSWNSSYNGETTEYSLPAFREKNEECYIKAVEIIRQKLFSNSSTN